MKKCSRNQKYNAGDGVALFFLEERALEDEEVEDADGDAAVGDVEDEAEEDEFAAAPDGERVGKGGFDEGEVEHIHHFAVEKRGIASAIGEECGDLGVCGVIENQAVESAVEDVA